MSDRRKYEGEEGLQLQLLEVTQDPTFGGQTRQPKGMLIVRNKMEADKPDVDGPDSDKIVH